MSHPRAVLPDSIAEHYRQHGGKATAVAYQTSWSALRRWLIDHGHPIRPRGLRLGFAPAADKSEAQRRYDRAYLATHREQRRAAYRRWYYANRQRAIQRVIDWRKQKNGAA